MPVEDWCRSLRFDPSRKIKKNLRSCPAEKFIVGVRCCESTNYITVDDFLIGNTSIFPCREALIFPSALKLSQQSLESKWYQLFNAMITCFTFNLIARCWSHNRAPKVETRKSAVVGIPDLCGGQLTLIFRKGIAWMLFWLMLMTSLDLVMWRLRSPTLRNPTAVV